MNARIKRIQDIEKYDKKLLIIILIFVFLGLVAIADASAPQALNYFDDKLYFVKQQAVWATGGIVVMFCVSLVKPIVWEKLATPLFILSIILLVLVLIPAFSFSALGARRWISLGTFSFQPSELVKLSVALFFAKLVSKKNFSIYFFLPLVLVTGLIMLQPDLGTTLIVASIGMVLIFLSGVKILNFVASLIIGALASLGLILTSSYRRQRLLTFFEHTKDPLGSDYHIRQILLSLGSGGLFGVGLGQGKQKFLFLPEAATDSIFATIAEEIGFVGSTVIIFLFVFIVFRGLKIARSATSPFNSLLAAGITTWIGVQAFLNIGSMVALVPLTGVPLPFFSYGGSSLVTILIGLGILLSISRYDQKK